MGFSISMEYLRMAVNSFSPCGFGGTLGSFIKFPHFLPLAFVQG